MKILLQFDAEDRIPCLCRIQPILTAFPQAELVVDPSYVGKVFAEKLTRAQVRVTLGPATEKLNG